MAIFSKNLGGHGPFAPPGYAYEPAPSCSFCRSVSPSEVLAQDES